MKTNKLVFKILTILSLLMIVATTIDIVVTCIINPERWTMIRSALGENLFIIVFDLLILGVIPLISFVLDKKKQNHDDEITVNGNYQYDKSLDYFEKGLILFFVSFYATISIIYDAELLNENVTDVLSGIGGFAWLGLFVWFFVRLFRSIKKVN